jgi:hypothetical protein
MQTVLEHVLDIDAAENSKGRDTEEIQKEGDRGKWRKRGGEKGEERDRERVREREWRDRERERKEKKRESKDSWTHMLYSGWGILVVLSQESFTKFLSWQSCPNCSALAVLSCYPYPGSLVLEVLSLQSCSSCSFLPVPFSLACSSCPF